MNGTTRTVAVVAVGLGLGGGDWARAASEDAAVSVTIVRPVAVETAQAMDFGDILPPTQGTQTFALSEWDAAVTPGTGDGAPYGKALYAAFSITGEPNRSLDVQAVVTRDFADEAITLQDLTVGGSSTFDADGAATVTVGGTLIVDATAEPAPHSDAIITVTVNYQ